MHHSISHTHLYPEEVSYVKKKKVKYAKLKSHRGNIKFNLQRNADAEPLDGYLLCLFLLGEIH